MDGVMSTRKRIVLAILAGCRNTRQLAKHLGLSHFRINCYFYGFCTHFINRDLLQWEPGKANTLRPGPNLAIIRDQDGQIKDIGRLEVIHTKERK